jgi:hypothetical protein
MFHIENKVTNMYKIYYLHPLKRFIQKIKLVVTYAIINESLILPKHHIVVRLLANT